MKAILLSAVLAGGLVLIGCSTSSSGLTDERLQTLVEDRIHQDPALQGLDVDVDAHAAYNEVTLTGTVPSQSSRANLLAAVKDAHPGVVINDKIDVEPPEAANREFNEEMAEDARAKAAEYGDKVGDSLDDAWIHTKVTAALLMDKETPGRKINVDVVDNVVTLRGKVATETVREEAERLAKQVKGVRSVVNRLSVSAG